MGAEARLLHEAVHVLVVEDDPSLRRILQALMTREGYQVTTAADGEEGLRSVEQQHPDLILLDVMMPKMDGRELCRRLKSNQRTSQIPIIMLTAMSEFDDRITGLDYGANDYITKPYEQRELLVRVRNLLDWGRIQRDANPLTGLPGNHGIEAELNARISRAEPFVFMYLDIDHFKAYNDYYGYQRGDHVIRLLALILREVVDRHGDGTDFIGHVGGDDYVLVLRVDHAQQVGDEVIRRFDHVVPELYDQVDRERKYIETTNRQGERQIFPIVTLTVAAVSTEVREITHVAQVSDIAAELKRFGKEQKRSILVWDRRGE